MVRAVGSYRLTVRLGDEARRGWAKGAHVTGCSITALLEAIGQELDRDPTGVLARGEDVIELARQVDEDRRKRR